MVNNGMIDFELDFEAKERNGDALVEAAAAVLGSRFFIDCGEGRDIETDTIYLMDLSGWLVPADKIGEFLKTARNDRWGDVWREFFCFAEWRMDSNSEGDDIKIDFKKYPIYIDEPVSVGQ